LTKVFKISVTLFFIELLLNNIFHIILFQDDLVKT
jgi:hypothetical protein